jgi:aspartyl-tRNA(Asn)/glutamyl-tRNA(Gln) amidotransferase subunit A
VSLLPQREGGELDATELAGQHARGERDVRETIEETLDAIERLDPRLRALACVMADSARKRADALDAARDHGFLAGPLCGVPVVLKSNLCVAGVETNCGSRILAGWRPPLSLEESLGKFEEGIRLARASQTHLDQAEARVEELLSMSEDGPVLEDIEVP